MTPRGKDASGTVIEPTARERFAFARTELRERTVRGVAVNAVFLAVIDAVTLSQGLIVSRLLGPKAIGLYGIVTITVASLLLLKRVGIDEAFVQQEEAVQETEFQRAFTLEVIVSLLFVGLICVSAPILAVAYGEGRLLPLTLGTAYLPLAFALQAPSWIFFRRMDFGRQRALQAVVPLVAFAVTIPLAASGVGVWSLVIGPLAGNVAGALAALSVTPYRMRLRYDPVVARRYLSFSGPIFFASLATLVISQGQVFIFDLDRGLTGAGFLTLAFTLTRYVDRADQVITATIYPVVCSLQGRTRALTELFVKSNRATLIWVVPFAGGVVLFAPDLVSFVIGERWRPAVVLLQGLAVATALQQVGFNWFSFYRAHGRTRETAFEAAAGAGTFLAFAVPGLLLGNTTGFVGGRIVGVIAALFVRRRFVVRLLPDVRLGLILLRSLAPLAVAVLAVVAVRFAFWGGHRPVYQAAAEVVLFLGLYAVATYRFERTLLLEALAAWKSRPGRGGADPAQATDATTMSW